MTRWKWRSVPRCDPVTGERRSPSRRSLTGQTLQTGVRVRPTAQLRNLPQGQRGHECLFRVGMRPTPTRVHRRKAAAGDSLPVSCRSPTSRLDPARNVAPGDSRETTIEPQWRLLQGIRNRTQRGEVHWGRVGQSPALASLRATPFHSANYCLS
jgi:hypothetical protein